MHQLDLDPRGRSHKLREMYWNDEQARFRQEQIVVGSDETSLVGKARDFEAVLDSTPAAMQDVDLLAGMSLAIPAQGSSIDLGEYDGHYTPGHANILLHGLTGIRDRATSKLTTETDLEKRDFLEAAAIAYEAARRFVAKHANHLELLTATESHSTRKQELAKAAAACRELSVGPATSFQGGLQMLWFTFLFGARGSIGRFDQWMYPLYRTDLDTGRLTKTEAQELLENYFVKLNYFAGNNDSLRNIALAGQTPQGKDACNELSYMCLIAGGRLMLPEPKLNVRFHTGSPSDLLELSCRLTCKGLSNPAYFNDDVAIPGLLELGIPIEDARDYCNDGCSELIIGGKSTIRFRNFDSLPSLCETVQRGEEESFGSFPEVMSDFQARLEDHIPNEHGQKRAVTFPYFAASLDDCLEEASVTGVRYSIWGSIPSQIGNVADGLAAIQRFIFDKESLTWEELNQALRDDFEGHEPLRQRILNRAPKYGNDDDEVDRILKQVSEKFCDAVHDRAQNPVGPGGKTAPGFMTFGIHRRRLLPASPDGRKYEDYVASSFSPALGRDRNSPTAVLKSVSKVDLRKAGHGSVLDMAFHPSALKGEEGLEKFMSFVDTFLKLPCTTTLQANVIDRETLLAARENPTDPQYRTLLVRVWGFSTVFVSLDPDLQQHVIERTEHEL